MLKRYSCKYAEEACKRAEKESAPTLMERMQHAYAEVEAARKEKAARFLQLTPAQAPCTLGKLWLVCV